MTTIFATDNALDVIREKVERIILVGKIFMLIRMPRLPYPAGGVRFPSHSPRLEPVPTGVLYVLFYIKRNKHIEERENKTDYHLKCVYKKPIY